MANIKTNNMIIVTDPYGRQKTILTNYLPKTPKFFEDGHLEQLDGLLTYQFSTLASDPATAHLIAGNNVIVRNKDRKLMLFTIVRTREERRDGKYVRTVFAENAAVDDLYNHIVDGEELRNVDVRDVATKILGGTGWSLGIVDYAGLQNINLNEYPTALAALHQIRDTYGLEMEFTVSFIGTQVRDKFVHLVHKRGSKTGKRFTFGKDLTGVTRQVDRSDIATAIIPIGKADENGKRLTIEAFQNVHDGYVSPKGQKWVGDDQALQLYGKNGKHLFKRLDLSGVENEYELMKAAVEELKRVKQPRATYEMSCLLLESLTGYEHEKVRLGDTILVKDTTFDPVLAVQARVISIYRSYTDPSKDYVVLGEFVPLVIDKNKQIEAIQQTINQNMTKWEQGGEVVLKSPNEPVKSKRTPDMLWLDTSAQPNIMKRWDAENSRWVNASVTTPQEIGAETPEGAQEKANKAEGTAIAEAAEDAAIKAKKAEDKAIEVAEEMDEEIKIELKTYVEGLTEEVEAEVKKHADQKAKDAELNAKLFTEGYAEKEFHYGDTPPEDLTQIWFDMSSTPNKIRKYNEKTKTWDAASPTKPSDIGAETPTETLKKAQDEAKKAQDAAIKRAQELDAALKTESERLAQQAQKDANAHTDEVTKLVEESLKQDAQNKADAAKKDAISDADRKLSEARKNLEQDAQNKANEAQKKAEENAAADAKRKADEAREQAKKDAATDAQNKANAAQKAATDRANQVKTEVENFAKDAGNITQGTLAAQRLHGVTISGKSAKIVDIDASNINAGFLDADRLRAGSIRADLIEFGGRARDVAENRPVTYTGGSGFSINGGMTARYNGAGSSRADKFPCTMSLDFGTAIGECVRIQWTSFYSNDARYAARSYKLETSVDGTNWTTWADVTNNTNPIVSYGVVGSGQVRYVRLTVRAPQEGQTSVNVANFEVHSVQAGTIVTGDAILTGRIDATKVNVDNLNAGNINSGTLHSDRIGANSINASKLQANSVTADKIAANAITADKLHVLAKSLVANTSITGNDSTGWDVSKHATSTIGLRGSANMGDVLVHGFTTADHDTPTLYHSKFFEVDPNQTYKFSIGMFLDKNNRNASQYFGVQAYDKNQKEIPMQPLHPTTGALSGDPRTNPYFWSGKDVSGSWRFMEGFAVSAQADGNEAPQGRNIQASYRMHPATKYLRMRFYSGYYPTVKNAAMEVLWWSPSVTAVDSGAIVADRITAGTIDANKVNVTNLKANNITSGTMTADRINGGTINANNTNIINLKAGNITSGTIDASKIGVTNLNAANITAGILNADRIGTKSISTYKLTIGDFTNYCVNPKFEGGSTAEWDGISVQAWNAAGVPAGSPTPQLGRMTGRRDATCGELFTAEQDERFYVEFQSAHISGNNQFAIGFICYDKDKKAIGYPAVRRNVGGWSRTTGEFITPANTKYVKVWAQINAFENHGDWVFTDVVIRKMTDSKLLVNGSVIADKIATNAVIADKIAAGAVNASKIAANSIDASKITAGAITTEKIAAAGISADKITSGVIDANRVQVRNLNAGNITGGTMSADRITGGTINANNTNIINLKAQNIASGTINADNVEISNGRVTINKDGVTVTDAHFLVKDARTGLLHTTAASTNLLYDHSFETLRADGGAIGGIYYNVMWDTVSGELNDSFWKWARWGTPKMANAYTHDVPVEASPFGLNAGLFNQSNYLAQRFGVTEGKQYTISFHAAKPMGGLAAGQPRLIIEHMKDNNVVHSETKDFPIPSPAAGDYVRYGTTITANGNIAGGRTKSIRVRFMTTNGNWCVFDGVQAVAGSRAAQYDAEDALWKFGQNRTQLDSINVRKVYGSDVVEGKVLRSENFQVPYKNGRAVVDHANGNVSFNAASGNVHLGNMNTNEIIADKVMRVLHGMSIRGKNENGVGLETNAIIRSWGANVEINGAVLRAPAVTFVNGAASPSGEDGTLWFGSGWQGLGFYVMLGGGWHTVVAGFGAG
ncbi:phage tail spike protein [Bacillus thuringiensis]|nr:phage tail spike protein [Bacillus thuringiensis]MED2829714.1 phage tail spike protein [Bacillus thuringiensis]MED2856335.1 phage tail spike protein [Bacillus thuringiensis]MED2863861.1 phage tail spike protein [Bacillus thuringiensis]